MSEPNLRKLIWSMIPVCSICFLYLCSFFLFAIASNALVYSTVCLLRANESFCSQIDQNKTLNDLEQQIQKETSQWCLYGTLSFGIIATFVSPIYGSLSDSNNRKLPIVLTVLNAIISGILLTVGSLFQGSKLSLVLYLVTNVVNGFGGGGLILISSCFGYATDNSKTKEKTVQTIAFIEASLNLGVVTSFLLSSFLFERHGPIWLILTVHLVLLLLAFSISLIFLKSRLPAESSQISFYQKLLKPFVDSHDLLVELKRNSLLNSFWILLFSLFFYEIYRMGSSSVLYLFLHHQSFTDSQYATFFTVEQTATCLALLLLATLRTKMKINDFLLSAIGLTLSLIGLFLFAFARNSKTMIFSAIPSSMFTIYFPVCLRAIIAQLIPERDKGKAFSFVALIQNLDVVIGTVVCIEIYQATIGVFSGAVFIFAVGTRVIALILLLIPAAFLCRRSENSVSQLIDDNEESIIDIENSDDDPLQT